MGLGGHNACVLLGRFSDSPLTVIALYLYGGGSLQGMAESQMMGIIIGTLSSIFVACPLLLWFGVSKQDLMPKARDLAALERRP